MLLPYSTFLDIFLAVQSSDVAYAVLPVENSTNGSVVQALDLLADVHHEFKDVKVCDETYVAIHHYLLTGGNKSGSLDLSTNSTGSADASLQDRFSRITKLYTHPQAWDQCRTFLHKYFNKTERQDVSSTSRAAELVAQDPEPGTSAAIASRFASETHGCHILAEQIEDLNDNTTRFLILNKEMPGSEAILSAVRPITQTAVPNTSYKTLITLQIPYPKPGALANALLVFKTHRFNLTSINSRPSRQRPWHYVFLVECDAPPGLDLQNALRELESVTMDLRWMGTWINVLSVAGAS